MSWKIKKLTSMKKLRNPVLIEGLPGIGNVGKIVVDFLIDQLKAKKVFELSSYKMPHSAFVNEKNLMELPKIEIYHKALDKRDILFLAGDIQPIDEESCYEFCSQVLDLVSSLGGKEVVTIGGIGLPAIPKTLKVYCTGNSEAAVKEYKSSNINKKLYGVVGPIIGVTGLLPGLAKRKNIKAVCFLAETYSHPLYLGVKGAKEITIILKKKFNLAVNIKNMDKEINLIEKEATKIAKEFSGKKQFKELKHKEVEYIG